MKLTNLSTLAIAAALAVPLGITAGNALAFAHGTPARHAAAQTPKNVESNESNAKGAEKADAESAKEPKEAVDRDNVQAGPGATQDGDTETNDGPGADTESSGG
ncbi:MAG: hypothetical protein M3Y18_08320 [Candidatus Eremiobacteraeota bacterium]|nr:hypothetical protein [Candidatus Eremiobacteraeota bacterium]